MSLDAHGTFEVTLTPVPLPSDLDEPTIQQMAIRKVFHGDLQGTSHGVMLSTGNPADGHAGYVGIERVTGTIGDRTGSFALQHSGAISAGVPSLAIAVVPGSGTGDLEGMRGTFALDVAADGTHSYHLRCELPEPAP